MNYPSEHPTLLVDELTLEAVTMDDFSEMDEIVSYRPQKDLTTPQMMDKISQEFVEKSALNWGIYLNNKLIGTVGYYRGFADDVGEIGYVLLKEQRRKGYATKAVQRAMEYGLNELGLKIIVAYTLETNDISKHLLAQLNFEQISTTDKEYIKFQLQKN